MLRVGSAYDKAPVQDEFRTPRLPDQDRVWAAGGVQWKISDRSAVDLGYAHLFIKDASSDLGNQADAGAPPKGDLVGTYNANVNIVSLQLSIGF
jgi:long-chain fatty acid transport protein